MSDAAISVVNLSKKYHLYDSPKHRLKEALHPFRKKYHRDFWALHNVSFEVKKGESLGIIGKNGSGKSTLLQLICGILHPTTGDVRVNGKIAALLELGAGFNPELTGRENVHINSALMGYSREEIELRLRTIEEFADIGEFIEQPVKTYSSGMFVRLAFASAASLDPDILVIDEALAVGDVFFRQKCYQRFEDLRAKGVTIILVSHAMTEVAEFCDRVLLFDRGSLNFAGNASEAVKRYYLIEQQLRKIGFSGRENIAKSDNRTDNITQFENACDSLTHPPLESFIDISNIAAVSNGWARCTGVALCNERGEPCYIFEQGERAFFYFEFVLLHDIEVPMAGVVIKNEKNIIVHGKSSLEYGSSVPSHIRSGNRVCFLQEIELRVAAGEYTFDVGLSIMPEEAYANRSMFHYAALRTRFLRICSLSNVGSFTVILRSTYEDVQLMHHGLCDLPGRCSVSLKSDNAIDEFVEQKEPCRSSAIRAGVSPAVFHITHWKAGSQWIYAILSGCAPELIVTPRIGSAHFTDEPLREGFVYPTLYLTKEQFYSVELPASWKCFIVMRDLRDTLISAYFSMLYSHAVISPVISQSRCRLQGLSLTEGLIYMIDEWLPQCALIQQSWLKSGELIVRYEDLLSDDLKLLEHILIDCCRLPVSVERLKEVVLANRFESVTGGRQRGIEDQSAHERKGIAGDWREHFTAPVKKSFKLRFGDLLIAAGYERDNSW